LLLLHLFDLLTLVLEFLLLLLNLALRLLILYLSVLQFVANDVAARCSHTATDRGTCRRMAHSRADYRSRTGTEQSAHASAFFALTQRLSRAPSY
jgi:hypothetical protein